MTLVPRQELKEVRDSLHAQHLQGTVYALVYTYVWALGGEKNEHDSVQ